MENIIKEIEQLIKSNQLYVINNEEQGCIQIAYNSEGKPDPDNDAVFDMDYAEWHDRGYITCTSSTL